MWSTSHQPVQSAVFRGAVGRMDAGPSALTFAVLMGLQTLGPTANAATYIGLSAWALLGARQSIQAFTGCWLLLFLNPEIFPPSPVALLLRWLVVGASGVSVVGWTLARRDLKVPREVLSLLVFCTVSAIAAGIQLRDPSVSVAKAIVLLASVFTILQGFRAGDADASRWRGWFEGLWMALVLGSLPLFWSELGYVTNQRSFQGLLNHPQAFGIVSATALAWYCGRLLEQLDERRWRRRALLDIVMIAASAALLIKSESRTAVAAVVLGGLLALIVRVGSLSKRSVLVALVIGGVFAAGVATSPSLKAWTINFLRKWDTEASLTRATVITREAMIVQSWENFKQHPLVGIGLGVESVPGTSENLEQVRHLGMPVSRPVEKGFLPTALLEETGVVGTLLFGLFIAGILLRIAKISAFPALWVGLTAVFINLGESVLLSPGGMGLFVWLVLGYAITQRRDGRSSNSLFGPGAARRVSRG